MIGTLRKLQRVQPAAWRHLFGRNARPYERILQAICAQKDIWITSQGDYIQWWRDREAIRLSVHANDGQCYVHASSPCAVIERIQADTETRDFLTDERVACPASNDAGEVVITIDRAMRHKATLIEFLRREGILNFEEGSEGDFFLAASELDPLLDEVYPRLRERKDQPHPDDVTAVREIVRKKLAQRGLPLLRVWYHPRVSGRVPLAVFSPRYDVDRAITNMPWIRALEQRYGVESTLYIRAFCPFYTDEDVAQLSQMPWCSEIALHGEFLTNGRVYGDEARAAVAERAHLEKTARVPVRGAGMHGGELTNNLTPATVEALHHAALQYDTTMRPRPGNHLPFRRILDGTYTNLFSLPHALSDINIAADRHYGENFYKETLATMRQIQEENGVFVLMMHPEYFGFFSYLARPSNLRALFRYMTGYVSGRSAPRAGAVATEQLAAK